MKKALIGSWINSASPIVAELMASAGFDFLTVDAEHSAIDLSGTQILLQAIRSGNPACRCFVRVPGCSYSEIKRYMDAGADGIICPLVNTPAMAEEVVAAVKYPPEGQRGLGFCRDNAYGVCLNERLECANRESFVCLQIEHVEGVENIEQILNVPGIDAVFVGPYDLSASMGMAAQFDRPEYKAACQQVLDAAEKRGIMAGIHVVQPDENELERVLNEGYRLVAYSLDITMIATACRNGILAAERVRAKK